MAEVAKEGGRDPFEGIRSEHQEKPISSQQSEGVDFAVSKETE
jgi:hypothetical protein